MWVLFETLVVCLTVARLTRLITTDELTRPARTTLITRLPKGSRLTYLVVCRWCASVWVAAPTAAAWCALSPRPCWSGRWWIDMPSVALALSYAAGLLVGAEPEG